jgi:hypothetical protein
MRRSEFIRECLANPSQLKPLLPRKGNTDA